ncbi:MAG: hypothetical protein U0263_15955 [Polyangiaceae bacterium]
MKRLVVRHWLAVLALAVGLFVGKSAAAQVSIPAPATPVTENFDSLANSGTSSAMPAGWAFSEAGTGANTTYTAGTGSATTGDTYSFGASGSNERALGALRSGSVASTWGASFVNDTGSPIVALAIAFVGEEWRLGAAGRVDQVDFQYSLDATSLTTGTWVDVNALDFVTPDQVAPTGAKNGNAAGERTALSGSISGFSIAPGGVFWIRWVDADVTGSDDGLAIDDFSISATVCSCVDQGAASCGTNGTCDAFGTCLTYAAGTTCRVSAGECDVAETCPGGGGACPADGLAGQGSSCTDDANPCTADVCDGVTTTCQHPAGNAGATCNDGAPGTCCGSTTTCCTGANCCSSGGFCTSGTATGSCGASGSACADCNDTSACTADACGSGTCTHTPVGCDDGNVCTADSCTDSSGCSHAPVGNGTPCSDGNPCNGLETCQTGTCSGGTPPNCDDANPCTADACDAVLGCTHTPVGNGSGCSDGNVCNGTETCQSGVCTAGSPLACDDSNPCTSDSCDSVLGCQHAAVGNGTSCTDGNACNGLETCQAGTCSAGAAPNCDDSNPCTADACDSALGCTHTPVGNGTGCTDGNVCNGAETCQGGVCTPGVALACDDSNTCTADSCDSVLGCQHAAVGNGTSCSTETPATAPRRVRRGAARRDRRSTATTPTCAPWTAAARLKVASTPMHPPTRLAATAAPARRATPATLGLARRGPPFPAMTTTSARPTRAIRRAAARTRT